ncbi:chorismate synthase [Luteibaculum oceani]|uniref:Chorismate synthase n=1 Tax=Luteibaculum oceani TaxID=1294296 RepID=A0A5C6V8M0_9FLAO|nr:chorismate synthase [Luteibaculum oceani]TXC81367.1 chorismate synthase [Luteibaculum oceani]
MAGNQFGKLFTVTTFGESHGYGIGAIIDGCPAGLEINEEEIQVELDRRKPGQSKLVTQRKEGDIVSIQSGIFEGITTGTPISLFIKNEDQKSRDYDHIKNQYRPSHADYTYDAKYGFRDYRGGGRSSARETAARVAAGAIAKKILKAKGIEILAFVNSVKDISIPNGYLPSSREEIDASPTRCPHKETAEKIEQLILKTRKEGNSVGGIISTHITGVPAGLGEPVFDRLHADLGKAMLSINAVQGFEYGSGFDGCRKTGLENNDAFTEVSGTEAQTKTNNSGGIQGGISNGQPIYFKVGFKPTATLMIDQESVDQTGEQVVVKGKGRHDPCVLPRAVPIVEAMAALVLCDHFLRSRTNRMNQL